MATIKQSLSNSSLKISKGADDTIFNITYIPQEVVLSQSSVTTPTIGDSNFDNSTAGSYYFGGRILITNSLSVSEIVDLTPSIGVTDSDGFITRVSSGIARFGFNDEGVFKFLDVDLRTINTASVVNEFNSVRAGSISEHISSQIDSRINDSMSMADNGYLFTTQNHSSSVYVRNVNFWGNDLDLTCVSPWNSNAANKKAGTLITPRHIIGAAHYEFGIGTIVRFATSSNVVVNRTVVGKKRHPNYMPYSPDLTVYTLNSDVPDTISFCKLMPSDYDDYLTNDNIRYTKPAAIGLDQEEKGLIIDMYKKDAFQTSTNSNRLIFNEQKVLYDSGNPAFVIVNGDLVLVTLWTFGGAGSGTAIADNIASLNQMIISSDAVAGVSTGYTVTEADFSGFPDYS